MVWRIGFQQVVRCEVKDAYGFSGLFLYTNVYKNIYLPNHLPSSPSSPAPATTDVIYPLSTIRSTVKEFELQMRLLHTMLRRQPGRISQVLLRAVGDTTARKIHPGKFTLPL